MPGFKDDERVVAGGEQPAQLLKVTPGYIPETAGAGLVSG